MSLRYEPSSEPIDISEKQLFLDSWFGVDLGAELVLLIQLIDPQDRVHLV